MDAFGLRQRVDSDPGPAVSRACPGAGECAILVRRLSRVLGARSRFCAALLPFQRDSRGSGGSGGRVETERLTAPFPEQYRVPDPGAVFSG